MKKYLILFLVVALASSCVSRKIPIVGSYSLKKVPKFAIRLNKDSTFESVFIIPNPFLHPFDHPGQEFSTATGRWHILPGNKIVLKNDEQFPIAKPQIALTPPTRNTSSRFVFYDVFHDTIPILSVEHSDHSVTMAFHRSMPLFGTSTQPAIGDTLKFHFYGYEIFNFIYQDEQCHDYQIKMYPPKRMDLLNNMIFKVRRRRIIATRDKLKLKFYRSDREFKL